MEKDDLKRLASNPNFISGIYNYCDRWCERCSFTSRCMNFAMTDEEFSDLETMDMKNDAFWRKLSESFQVTLELLKEMAEERGIDLDALPDEEDKEKELLRDEISKNHICSRAAQAYGEMVDEYFDSTEEMFKKKEDPIKSEMDSLLGEISHGRDKTGLEDAVEVIGWYQHQIYVKLLRAIRGELEEESELLDEFPRDSDGSAKVALIGIDRSIAAWGEVRGYFPMLQRDVMDILVHLERLRSEVEKSFPNARDFIRPGFDKINLNS